MRAFHRWLEIVCRFGGWRIRWYSGRSRRWQRQWMWRCSLFPERWAWRGAPVGTRRRRAEWGSASTRKKTTPTYWHWLRLWQTTRRSRASETTSPSPEPRTSRMSSVPRTTPTRSIGTPTLGFCSPCSSTFACECPSSRVVRSSSELEYYLVLTYPSRWIDKYSGLSFINNTCSWCYNSDLPMGLGKGSLQEIHALIGMGAVVISLPSFRSWRYSHPNVSLMENMFFERRTKIINWYMCSHVSCLEEAGYMGDQVQREDYCPLGNISQTEKISLHSSSWRVPKCTAKYEPWSVVKHAGNP